MAYEDFYDKNIPQKIIPAGIKLGEKYRILDYGFKQGDVVKFGGMLNAQTKELDRYTFTRDPAEGKKFVIVHHVRVLEVSVPAEQPEP